MGQVPAKMFQLPQPYGSTLGMNVLQQAKQAPMAPMQQFLPTTFQEPGTMPAQTQGQMMPADFGPNLQYGPKKNNRYYENY